MSKKDKKQIDKGRNFLKKDIFFLRRFFFNISKNGNVRKNIPLGLVKNNKPKVAPVSIGMNILTFGTKYQIDRKYQVSNIKETWGKSIK